MVTVSDIVNFMHDFAPPSLAESYDNVGLLIGDATRKVQKVLVCLDADGAVAQEAKEQGVDMVVSHHPLIFNPLSRIVTDDAISKTAISLIKNDIALCASHTNFDSVKSGLCDLFLDKICKTKNRTPIEGEGEDGVGRYAILTEPKKLSELLTTIKGTFDLSTVRYVGNMHKEVSSVAVCNGGGAEFVYQAKTLGADCYISGDIKYQHARFAYENDVALIEIPHYSAEKIFVPYAKKLLSDRFGKEITVIEATTNIDVWNQF